MKLLPSSDNVGGTCEVRASRSDLRSHRRHMPERGSGFDMGWQGKNDGWCCARGAGEGASPAFSFAVPGTAAQGCHFRPAHHKKTTIRSTNGRASRDVSWCTAPTSPGAEWAS